MHAIVSVVLLVLDEIYEFSQDKWTCKVKSRSNSIQKNSDCELKSVSLNHCPVKLVLLLRSLVLFPGFGETILLLSYIVFTPHMTELIDVDLRSFSLF